MNKSTKNIFALVILIVGVAAIASLVWVTGQKGKESEKLVKVGAILPLSGPAAVFGEPLKNGLQMALKDRSDINVIYEDSKASPSDGASAYQKLTAEGVNVMVSAYSGVSVPLTKLAAQNKTPLIMTIVAADNVTNEYSYRYYAKPNSYVEPAFTDADSPLNNLTDIAILYRNDEFGKAVSGILDATIKAKGKKVLISEVYKPNETDFSTSMAKIKAAKPQALIFVSATSAEAVGIINKAYELKVETVLVEASAAMTDAAAQKKAAKTTYYTTGFKFSLPGDSLEFKNFYKNTFNAEPNFAAAFGYDIGKLIVGCVDGGGEIQDCLSKTTSVNGITGEINGIKNNEINPPMFLMKIN